MEKSAIKGKDPMGCPLFDMYWLWYQSPLMHLNSWFFLERVNKSFLCCGAASKMHSGWSMAELSRFREAIVVLALSLSKRLDENLWNKMEWSVGPVFRYCVYEKEIPHYQVSPIRSQSFLPAGSNDDEQFSLSGHTPFQKTWICSKRL